MNKSVHVTYDENNGLGYIALKRIGKGEARRQRHVLGDNDIILDFNKKGALIGIELLRSSLLHPDLKPGKVDEYLELAIRLSKNPKTLANRLKADEEIGTLYAKSIVKDGDTIRRLRRERKKLDAKSGYKQFEAEVERVRARLICDEFARTT